MLKVVQAAPFRSSRQISAEMKKLLIGQDEAIDEIIPYIRTYQAGLAPDGRPIGVFFLAGPTGTGKTKTVEVLAQVLHGSAKSLIRIDCGEMGRDHEVAKIIGAPPGYLGHRETQPLLSQQLLNSVVSEKEPKISIVLFDEIEKGSNELHRLLLSVFDKARLTHGDNKTVDFQNTIIFMTSNLGAKEIVSMYKPALGFESAMERLAVSGEKLSKMEAHIVRKRFAAEFINRIDKQIVYKTLGKEQLFDILVIQLNALQDLINARGKNFKLKVSSTAGDWLIANGTSIDSGARELNRLIQREIVQPITMLLEDGQIEPGSIVSVKTNDTGLFVQTD